MARLILVAFSLKSTAFDYTPFIQAIKESGAWWSYLPCTYIVHTDATVEAVAEVLKARKANDDHYVVLELSGTRQGWLPEEAWKWFRDVEH